MKEDQPPTNPDMYDGAHGKLTMAIFELFSYEKEHVPITPKNVDVFEKGVNRYTEKIEKMYQEYFESLSVNERGTIGKSVAMMIDRILKGTRAMITEARRQKRIYRAG
jgi:hypothetical protein